MCGIAGILQINQTDINSKIMNILKGQSHRGKSSCGVAYFVNLKKGDFMNTIKQLVPPENFDITDNKINSTVVVAHNRAPSIGEVKIQNAHPFTDCTNRIALVHNGTSSTIKAVRPILQLHSHKLHGNTDSEVFVHILEDYMNNTDDLDKAMKEFYHYLKDIVDTHFTILVMVENQYIYALRNGEDLVYANNDNEILIASEYDAIKDAMDKTKYSSVIPTDEALIKFSKKNNLYIDYLEGKPDQVIQYDPEKPNESKFKEPTLPYMRYYKYNSNYWTLMENYDKDKKFNDWNGVYYD